MLPQARYNITELSDYVYAIFKGSYFTDDKIYEVLPEKLVDTDNYFVYYYYAVNADINAYSYVDVICEFYVKMENGQPNWTERKEGEKQFNEAINNAIVNKIEGFEDYSLILNSFRTYLAEDGYNIITQSVRIIKNFTN